MHNLVTAENVQGWAEALRTRAKRLYGLLHFITNLSRLLVVVCKKQRVTKDLLLLLLFARSSMATEPTVFETKLTGSPSNIGRPMPDLPWRHPVKQGFATVGENRLAEPISMYYELHGNGPKKAAFIMGPW